MSSAVGQFWDTLENTRLPSCKIRSASNSTPSRYCSRRRSLRAREIAFRSGIAKERASLQIPGGEPTL
jgi:hypothetical protein